jgi:hypothetical protein
MDTTTFILVSFEGPDRYSLAGGLGVRVAELSRTLAAAGHRTHVLFVGDPAWPAVEVTDGGRLVLHRWCQWLSKYYPGGVYEGEETKLSNFNESAPPFIVDGLVRPALTAGQRVVVLGEEWQTAEVMCRVSDLLHDAGLRSRVLLLWNANNTMGFARINWGRLDYVTTITTVSRYMKHLMWACGVNPLVIPNGIPRHWLDPQPAADVARLRRSLGRGSSSPRSPGGIPTSDGSWRWRRWRCSRHAGSTVCSSRSAAPSLTRVMCCIARRTWVWSCGR